MSTTIRHPKALVLDALVEAGVPSTRLHETAERIAKAYDEVNARAEEDAHADAAADSMTRREP